MTKKIPEKAVPEPQEAVKRLLILQLYLAGVSTKDLGELLGVSYKTIERMLPSKVKQRTDTAS